MKPTSSTTPGASTQADPRGEHRPDGLAYGALLAAVLFTIGALGTGFINGYSLTELADSRPMGGETVARVAPWVLAGLAAIAATLAGSLRTPPTARISADRADVAATSARPLVAMVAPFASLFIASGLGILTSPAETDAFDGWSYLAFALVMLIASAVLQARRRRRLRELKAISRKGIAATGVVREHKTYFRSEEPMTKVSIEYTGAQGEHRTMRADLPGHIAPGDPVRVRYLANDPHVRPAVLLSPENSASGKHD